MPGLYDDAPDEPAAQEAPAAPEEGGGEEKEEAGEHPTAELPKAVLGGKDFKPGDEVMLKVEKVMEDSVLVSYAPGKEEGGGEEEAPPEPAQAPMPGSMGAMMG